MTGAGALEILDRLQRSTEVGISKIAWDAVRKLTDDPAPEPEASGEPMVLLPQTVVSSLMAEFRLHASHETVSLHRVRGEFGIGDSTIMAPERAAIYVQEKDAELLRTLVEASLRMYGIRESRDSKSKDTRCWHINKRLADFDVEALVPSCMTRIIIPTAQ